MHTCTKTQHSLARLQSSQDHPVGSLHIAATSKCTWLHSVYKVLIVQLTSSTQLLPSHNIFIIMLKF